MKKTLCLILALCLVLGLLPAASAAQALPAAGETVGGFTVTQVGHERLIDSPTVLFTHNKTGGQVLYYASGDTDRAFDITFKTPALDNAGLPHVFEHICISGSQKYPHANLFFPVANQTYSTFVNAMTSNNMTTYPLASLSEDQLYLMTDYYLSGVFQPLLYTEPRLVQREAWRYELTEAEAPLRLSGTVYNEMKGALTIETMAHYNLLDALFPGSLVSNISGGDPEHIPELTQASLLAFHQEYYHPSNALVVLYGDLDYAHFLSLIDSYYSQFERRSIDVPTGEIAPLTQPVSKTYAFPVEAGSSSQGNGIVSYGFVPQLTEEHDSFGMMLLAGILQHSSSPLMQAFQKTFPGATLQVGFNANYPQPFLLFSAYGLGETDREPFRILVDAALAKIVADGLNAETVEAILAAEQFSQLTIPEQSSLGVNLAVQQGSVWATSGSLSYFNDYFDAMEYMKEQLPNHYFEQLIQYRLLPTSHRASVATVPTPGLAEQKAQQLADRLAAQKAAMGEQELQAILAQTVDIPAWGLEEPPREMIRSLQAVTVDSLPEEIKQYTVTDRQVAGIKTLTANANVGDIGMTVLLADSSGIAQEDLHHYQLYADLIGALGTSSHAESSVSTKMTRYLYGFSASASLYETGDSFHPALVASWMGLPDEMEQAMELANELLFHTSLDNAAGISGIVSRLKLQQRNSLNSMPYVVQASRLLAADHPIYAYSSYLRGLEYYNFLEGVERQLAEDPQALLDRLSAVQSQLANRSGIIALYAGNTESIARFESSLPTLLRGLEQREIVAADYSGLPLPQGNEAIAIDATVQFNMLGASLEQLGITYNGKLLTLLNLLNDAYLTPQIRHGLGAYGVLTIYDEHGLLLSTYRDPAVAESYAVMEQIGDYLRGSSLTQEDVERYIISTYSSYAMPTGELSGASTAMINHLQNRGPERRITLLQQIKSLTVEDLKTLADAFDRLAASGRRSTAGGAAVIEQNRSLFDHVLSLGIAQGGDQAMTRAELASVLMGGVDNAFALCIEAGLIRGDGEGNYREQDPVTRQELAAIFHRLLQEPAAEQPAELADLDSAADWAVEALQYLASIGVLQADEQGRIHPTAPVTAAEANTMVLALMTHLMANAAA